MLLAYGPRYAPDQFEAEVPPDLQPADLVAAGGLIGRMRSSHDLMQDPTQVIPIGLLADDEGVVTLDRCAPLQHSTSPPARWEAARPSVIAVLGTSMNSGKTTTVASIVRGLTAAGHRVAAGKATGTGAGGDSHMYADAGAERVLDFTDFGFSSTYQLDSATVTAIFTSLVDELADHEPDVIVAEIADGLLQPETSNLIVDPWFHDIVDKVVFSAGDAMGAMTGLAELRRRSLDPVAVAGLVTASPLAVRETERVVDVPVMPLVDLCTPEIAERILAPAAHSLELKPVAAG
jgi:dethiobiotin synthetase